jgi:hypothetical protein
VEIVAQLAQIGKDKPIRSFAKNEKGPASLLDETRRARQQVYKNSAVGHVSNVPMCALTMA